MRRHRGVGGVAIANSRHSDAASLAKVFEPSRPARPSPLAASTIRGIPVDLVERIRSFSFFAEASEDFLVAIGSCLRLQVHNAQTAIVNEGDEAKAMYWLIRGSVVVTSRDRESIYAELRPGALFGEIGILMDVPRTASVVARSKTLVARLNKEDLEKQLPSYPEVERALREEAAERLAILQRKKAQVVEPLSPRRHSKRTYDLFEDADSDTGDEQPRRESHKKRPVPPEAATALGTGAVNVRQLLRKLPLFEKLPDEFLHFLGLNAVPRSFAPFTTIVKQRTTGRDVFFITEGTVEVFTEDHTKHQTIHARLQTGQFFGEVTSLWLAPERTASVRSIGTVECLVLKSAVIDELWKQCPGELKKQVEDIARQRLHAISQHGEDVEMSDPDPLQASTVPFREVSYQSAPPTAPTSLEPFDPDPFMNSGPRRGSSRGPSRRGSLANIPSETSPLARSDSSREDLASHFDENMLSDKLRALKRPRGSSGYVSLGNTTGTIPSALLAPIFSHLNLVDLMQLRRVCRYWKRVINDSPDILSHLDLSLFNRKVTDDALINYIAPFVARRPKAIDLSNCHHVTDEGFSALMTTCGENVVFWRIKSVWEIGWSSLMHMSSASPNVVSVDFSNCRKVSDHLLTRVVGWMPRPAPNRPATFVGCPKLSRLVLSYCKHVSDRFMEHVAHHAADRLEDIDLTRCTTISDMGFRHWGAKSFPRLRRLVLADCTYLSDAAMANLARAAPGLLELDLSFCCALSDGAVEKISAGMPNMRKLDLAFCGSAVSDASMASIARGMRSLESLSVRGCVRVTRRGVEAVLAGCRALKVLDVSQCRNLAMDSRWKSSGVRFRVVADGKWRAGR